MRFSTRMLIVAALAIGGACGDPGAQLSTAPPTGFCARFAQAERTGNESDLADALALAPPDVRSAAQRSENADDIDAADRAWREVTLYVETACHPEDAAPGAAPSDRRVAPPVDATPDGLRLCSAGRGDQDDTSTDRAVLYGRGDIEDPYSAPMLGLFWGGDGHEGDGPGTPVMVRGQRGVAAPITVFQQVILETLGTVIAWQEDGLMFGLYGRGWSLDRADELVAIAEQMQDADGRRSLPAAALPRNYGEVFAGGVGPFSLIGSDSFTYEVSYQAEHAGDGMVILAGMVATEAEFQAMRFLALGVEPATIAGQRALVGNAWSDTGPAVAALRDEDGLVLRVVGLDVDLDEVRRVAGRSRQLSRPEWIALVEGAEGCSFE